MKHVFGILAAALLFPACVHAATQASPNFSINAGRITSGGGSAGDAAGMAKSGIAIGQGVFVPAVPASSESFGSAAVVLPAAGASGLQVSTLPDGATSATSPITLTGKVNVTPLPESLTVNGIPVRVNPDGTFAVSVPLATGSNTMTITMVSPNGKVVTQSRTVTYNPTAASVMVTTLANGSTVPFSETTIPVGGTVGANVAAVTISLNGGAPQRVEVTNSSFSAVVGTLAPGLNTILVTTDTGSRTVLTVWRGDGGSLLAHTGDVNGDGRVDVVDALLALKAGIGFAQLSSAERWRGDVAPLRGGVPLGDGLVDIEDAVLILRKAVGLGW